MMVPTPELKILYADDAIVVVNKPGGLLSVPGRGPDKQDCVVSRLQTEFRSMIEQPAVHRLDMFTSGLMVVAISRVAHRRLCRQFEQRAVTKEYTAVLQGDIKEQRGEIHLPFRVDLNNRPLQMYDPVNGKMGITLWERLSRINNTTRVKFTPMTGRTHQLRVHAAHSLGLGCPIVGDSLYGSGKDGDKMFLHANLLRFTHPLTDQVMEFICPPDF